MFSNNNIEFKKINSNTPASTSRKKQLLTRSISCSNIVYKETQRIDNCSTLKPISSSNFNMGYYKHKKKDSLRFDERNKDYKPQINYNCVKKELFDSFDASKFESKEGYQGALISGKIPSK